MQVSGVIMIALLFAPWGSTFGASPGSGLRSKNAFRMLHASARLLRLYARCRSGVSRKHGYLGVLRIRSLGSFDTH